MARPSKVEVHGEPTLDNVIQRITKLYGTFRQMADKADFLARLYEAIETAEEEVGR